jgi:hypothetical protein
MLKSRHHKAAGSADQLQQKTRTAEPQKHSGTNKEMLPNQKKIRSRNSFNISARITKLRITTSQSPPRSRHLDILDLYSKKIKNKQCSM